MGEMVAVCEINRFLRMQIRSGLQNRDNLGIFREPHTELTVISRGFEAIKMQVLFQALFTKQPLFYQALL